MANTHGFGVVIQATRNVLVKAMQGAWKSAECPDQADNTGRIPEFIDIPGGLNIGGFTISEGQVQLPQNELDAAMAPDVNGAELILGMNVQLHIDNPPVPAAQLLNFHCILHAKSPVGTLPEKQDVGILLSDIIRANVWAILDAGHPLDPLLDELLREYVHTAYEQEVFPHLITENGVGFGAGTCNTSTVVYDDEANVNRQILTSFPDPNTLQISIPIYLRMFAFNPSSILGNTIQSPMGIETRIIIQAPFIKNPSSYEVRFGDVTAANVSIGTIAGAGADIAGNPHEADNYTANKSTLSGFVNLDDLLATQLKTKGVSFAQSIGNRTMDIPSQASIETVIADNFFTELTSRKYLALWTPTASNDVFHVDSVDVKVFPDSLNIALNAGAGADINALTLFVPAGMDFSIAMDEPSLKAKIDQAVIEKGFDHFPVRFHEDDHDVDLHSLNISVIDHAIRLEGTVTVIDAVLGSIDVDASFTTDVGLHWEPSGSQNAQGFQKLKHHIIGDPDVDVDEGIAFWIVAIILTVISFGVGGVLIGVITIIIILVVQAIVENIGSDSLVDGVTGAIDGITAWPPSLSNIGRVKAVFVDPVDISVTGLVLSGNFEVLSTCESTQVVPATTALSYITKAAQNTNLIALRTLAASNYTWKAGDGTPTQMTQDITHVYEQSGYYVAEHTLKVTQFGGAFSRHFGLVTVKNVPPVVSAGIDITVNEGEIVTLTGTFEDIEFLDTHTAIWNFGDNQPLAPGVVNETNVKPKATGTVSVKHAWCDNGIYTVTLQVFDNNGGVGTDTITVTVLNVPPVVKTPETIFAYPCSPITLVGQFTDPGWCDTHTATWNFGDCSFTRMATVVETNQPPAAKGTATASHTYKKCGSQYAECVVTDDDGGVGKSGTIVQVIELKNAHFNLGFTYSPLGKVADFWNAFPDAVAYAAAATETEIYFCEKCLVLDGEASQRIVVRDGSFRGIYQQLGANIGWEYQLSVMYQLRAAASARLGIDPSGGTDPSAAGIEWASGQTVGEWANLLRFVRAKATTITFFLGIDPLEKSIAEGCFDLAELTCIQGMPCDCNDDPQPPPAKRTCVDFTGHKREEQLPAVFDFKNLRFTTVDAQPNRIVVFPPQNQPGLEIRRGLLIDFPFPVSDVQMKLGFFQQLDVMLVMINSSGQVIGKETYHLDALTSVIYPKAEGISRIQLMIKGEGSLVEVCYRKAIQSPLNTRNHEQ